MKKNRKSKVKTLTMVAVLVILVGGLAQKCSAQDGEGSSLFGASIEDSLVQAKPAVAEAKGREHPLAAALELPSGVSITGRGFFHSPDGVEYLEIVLVIKSGVRIESLAGEIEKAGVLPKGVDLGKRIGEVHRSFGRERIYLYTLFRVAKDKDPFLETSHLCVGDVKPSPRSGDHRIEISESILQNLSKTLLANHGVLNKRLHFQYEIPVLVDTLNRRGWVSVTSLKPVCTKGGLEVVSSARGWVELIFPNKGVNLRAPRTVGRVTFRKASGPSRSLWLHMAMSAAQREAQDRAWRKKNPNVLEVSASMAGPLLMNAGTGLFDGKVTSALAAIADTFLPKFAGILETVMQDAVEKVAVIEEGKVGFRDASITRTRVSFRMNTLRVSLDKTLERFVGDSAKVPVALKTAGSTKDRVFFVFENLEKEEASAD